VDVPLVGPQRIPYSMYPRGDGHGTACEIGVYCG
jgi:hypothetical protein